MKKPMFMIISSFLLMSTFIVHGQKATDVFLKLEAMPDQFNNMYEASSVNDELTLIYVPGTNNPFQKIYFKQKAAQTIDNVLLVGGFKEIMNAMSREAKRKHLQEALSIQYKRGSKILIDMDSELGQLLELKGYSIVTISKSKNAVTDVQDFGFDRVAFFQALKLYEKS